MKRVHIVSSLVFAAFLSVNVLADAGDAVVAKFNGGSLKVSDLKKFQATAPDQTFERSEGDGSCFGN